MFFMGCASEKFMGWLASQGDAFTESVELGKKAKAIMFECDFEENCTMERIVNLIRLECQSPEKFDMINQRECEIVFEKQLIEVYHINRQYMGLS